MHGRAKMCHLITVPSVSEILFYIIPVDRQVLCPRQIRICHPVLTLGVPVQVGRVSSRAVPPILVMLRVIERMEILTFGHTVNPAMGIGPARGEQLMNRDLSYYMVPGTIFLIHRHSLTITE